MKNYAAYPNFADLLNFGDFLEFSFDLGLAIALEVQCFVHNGLGQQVLDVLLVFLARHVQAVRVLRNNFTSPGDLKKKKNR